MLHTDSTIYFHHVEQLIMAEVGVQTALLALSGFFQQASLTKQVEAALAATVTRDTVCLLLYVT